MALKLGRALQVARQLDMMWENWRQIIALGFLDGQTVTVEDVSGSSVDIYHGLGRQPRGWMVQRARNVRVDHETAADDTTLTLSLTTASADNLLTVLVY